MGGLTSVEVILLGDDLPPVLGTLSGELLGLVQAADGQGLDVLLEGLLTHLLQSLLHGAEESLHAALQVVRRLLRLDDEPQALHPVGSPRPAEHNVTFGGLRRGVERSSQRLFIYYDSLEGVTIILPAQCILGNIQMLQWRLKLKESMLQVVMFDNKVRF